MRNEERLVSNRQDTDTLQANNSTQTTRTSKAHGKRSFLSLFPSCLKPSLCGKLSLRLYYQLANLNSEDEQISNLSETKRCWSPIDRIQTLFKPIIQLKLPELAELMVSGVSFLFFLVV